jgi:hypothetical protein
MPRIELRDGQWADLRERITHGTDKAIKNARLVSRKDDAQAFDWTTVLVRAFVRDWSVRDPDGQPIAIADADAIDRAPDDVIDVLFSAAAEAWVGATVPNSPTPPSSGA